MNKYEISLWEDYPDINSSGIHFLNERKLCVIGSDTMTSMIRATEPKMVNNVNGTNTFSFKIYYTYIDDYTGEERQNPFIPLLINERKVKVFWKNEWYDLIIKNIDEDSANNCAVYTCKDSYITELSKNGYNLEFTSDLQNNNGTAAELVERTLEGSGWSFDKEGSTKIYQTVEEPVYEIKINSNITATTVSPTSEQSITIPAGSKILLFRSSLNNVLNSEEVNIDVNILYSSSGQYQTEVNEMLVLNGTQCTFKAAARYVGTNIIITTKNEFVSITVPVSEGVSSNYRGNRLVLSQVTAYDKIFDRFVNVYTDTSNNNSVVYGFQKTEFSDPFNVINLFVNSSNFSNTSGWSGNDLTWTVFPELTSITVISEYAGKGYLGFKANNIYTNSGLSANSSYLKPSQGDIKRGNTGGFHSGDIYVFRIKALKSNVNTGKPINSYVSTNSFIFNVKNDNNTSYFELDPEKTSINDNWVEYQYKCKKSCPASKVKDLKLTLQSTIACWVEDVEFFKYTEGITTYDSDDDPKRINPGEVDLQSVAYTVYKFYNPIKSIDNIKSAEDVSFIYIGEESPSRFVPKTSYEKIATIEQKESNRFNILQAIAESFECWVRFKINHDSQGKVVLNKDTGLPEKYITLVEYVGEDLGWNFEYGIDLRAIKRKIISDEIATKVIVVPNQNEFAKNGFCTIARSPLNYSKETFILNLDYYINQGLLDRHQVDLDLYSSFNSYIGYFYHLNRWNTKYDKNTEILSQKNKELTKQSSELTVLKEQLNAINEEITSCESDVANLASASSFSNAQTYVRNHINNTKIQSLMGDISKLKQTRKIINSKIAKLNSSITILTNHIKNLETAQVNLVKQISNIHDKFFSKYSRYIQEGTWIDEDYIDDDKYYLDGLSVAYTSSRPQVQYDINVVRLSDLDDYSSKIFHVGDVCYIKDKEFFNYVTTDGLPYRLKIIISEITSYFDSPEKDTIKVQNYKTQFDDLFERISAATQTLQFSNGSYAKAASIVSPDKTLNFGSLQQTIDDNGNLVLNTSNQNIIWDSTGIIITDTTNMAQKLKIMSSGILITNDGGATWKNAVRGDGISASILTAGRINVGEVYIYNKDVPTFRWDSNGITAYNWDTNGVNLGKFVRHDQFGFYGYDSGDVIQTTDFIPSEIDDIINNNNVTFGLTWNGFFMRAKGNNGSVFINTNDPQDNVIKCMKGTTTTFVLNKNGDADFSGTISAGTINADTVIFRAYDTKGKGGGFKCDTGDDGTGDTYGAKMFGWGAENSSYFIATNAGVRMTNGTGNSKTSFYCAGGVIKASESIDQTSDRREKHDITYNLEEYEPLFKLLKPTTYKYNNGASDRKHIGFISQDFEEALNYLGIDTQDFAALVKEKIYNDDGEIIDYRYGIRYSELIGLNTHMIQKLLDRIEILEQKLENLNNKEEE